MPSSSSSTENQKSRDTAVTPNNSKWRQLIPHSLGEVLLLALVVLVISIHINYVWRVRAMVPHQDDWTLLDEMFQSIDAHGIGGWLFQQRNGHFVVPACFGYLVSLHCLSLDLTPLRFLNFPIFFLAFLLTAQVINIGVASRLRRFFLYLGACFVIFNLCHWGHFTVAAGFTTILSALFGALGLYFLARATQLSSRRKTNIFTGLGFLIASVLSFGTGYAATAAAVSLFALLGLKKLVLSRTVPGLKIATYCLVVALGIFTIAIYQSSELKQLIATAFRAVVVAGSVWSSFFDDKNSVMVQNIAVAGGLSLVVASLYIGRNFATRQTPCGQPLPIFSLALILFGLSGCLAVAFGRSQLPLGELLATRYTLYPSIWLLGTLLYFAGSRALLLGSMWCLAAAGYIAGTAPELGTAPYRPAAFKAIEVAIENIDLVSDEDLQTTLYWRENTAGVRRVVERMRKDRLNVFRANQDTSDAQH